MPEDENDTGKALKSVGEKAEKLQGELEPEEALDVLEEAVGELERLGEGLEKDGS